MVRDINLDLSEDAKSFSIVNKSQIHPLARAAITLLFFSPDSEMRQSFSGLYHIIGKYNDNSIDEIDMDLAAMSFSLTEYLQQSYPEVLSTSFDIKTNQYSIDIILTIVTADETISQNLYNTEV